MNMSNGSCLYVEKLSMRFGGVQALNEVSVDVRVGEIHALIGPNGSGKSTLINCVCGVNKPVGGSVKMDDTELTGLPVHARVRLGLSRTFQNLRIARGMTTIENVLVAMHTLLPGGYVNHIFWTKEVRRSEEEARERAMTLLRRVGLAGKERVMAGSLTHGDAKRLEIARALACEPRILLLDEPVAGLGDAERESVIATVQEILAAGNLGVLLVEHSMRTVMSVSDRISVLDHGVIIARGRPEEIQSDERVIESYLGRRLA